VPNEPQALVERFNRMVARDGGSLTLIAADAETIRVGYRLGDVDPECEDGSCTLPQVELEKLMSETVARTMPGTRVRVEVMA
jgi:hypothetical protein